MKILKLLLLSLVAAIAAHLISVWAVPRAGMQIALHETDLAGGYNALKHYPAPDAWNQWVVTPSPDLLYSVCAYDIAGGPVWISGPNAPAYWSWSLYADDSDNFERFNDQNWQAKMASQNESTTDNAAPAGNNQFAVAIVLRDQKAPASADWVIRAPTIRGFAVYRLGLADFASSAAAQRWQQQQHCGRQAAGSETQADTDQISAEES